MHLSDHKNKTGRAVSLFAVLAISALLAGGCGKDGAQPAISDDTGTAAAVQEAKPVAEIYQEIEQAVSLRSPILMDDDFIMNYYGIDSSRLDEYVFSMSEDATQAECVIIMKAKDTADLDELAGCLQVVVDEKKNEMEDYLPEQFSIVEKSTVETKGSYVWLVISEQADTILDIIEKNTADRA